MNQSVPTWISVENTFNLSNSNFTIEAFIILANDSTNDWHHVATVYNIISGYTNLYIDGVFVGQLASLSQTGLANANITMTIGYGFDGTIDQLSISLEAKTDERILSDATVAAYFSFDGNNNAWLLDDGPNCRHATSAGTLSVPGQVGDALYFNNASGYYQANGFTVLNILYHAFSVALWVRPENQSGIFLTIANSMACLLVMGIRSSDNQLIAYLPNATNTSMGVSIVRSSMTQNQWVQVTFTWSSDNQARLYKETLLQSRNTNATKLNNGYDDSMSITLGMYHGQANCTGGDGLDVTTDFIGSLDEFYVFSSSCLIRLRI